MSDELLFAFENPIQLATLLTESTNSKKYDGKIEITFLCSESSFDVYLMFPAPPRSKGQHYTCPDEICSNTDKNSMRTRTLKNSLLKSALTAENLFCFNASDEQNPTDDVLINIRSMHIDAFKDLSNESEHLQALRNHSSPIPLSSFAEFAPCRGGTLTIDFMVKSKSTGFPTS